MWCSSYLTVFLSFFFPYFLQYPICLHHPVRVIKTFNHTHSREICWWKWRRCSDLRWSVTTTTDNNKHDKLLKLQYRKFQEWCHQAHFLSILIQSIIASHSSGSKSWIFSMQKGIQMTSTKFIHVLNNHTGKVEKDYYILKPHFKRFQKWWHQEHFLSIRSILGLKQEIITFFQAKRHPNDLNEIWTGKHTGIVAVMLHASGHPHRLNILSRIFCFEEFTLPLYMMGTVKAHCFTLQTLLLSV